MERITLNVPSTPEKNAADTSFATQLKAQRNPMGMKMLIPVAIVIVLLGVGTGYVGATLTASSTSEQLVSQTGTQTGETKDETQTVKVGQVVGAKDASGFKDSAEGVLLAGGVDGEGSHHLVRPGGKTQSVYLTSSVMDLKLFENAKVKVYGETFKAQKAGWLMDVGRLEVLQTNAQLPDGAQPEDLMGGDE